MPIQLALLTAAQLQALDVVTDTVPAPALALAEALVGETE